MKVLRLAHRQSIRLIDRMRTRPSYTTKTGRLRLNTQCPTAHPNQRSLSNPGHRYPILNGLTWKGCYRLDGVGLPISLFSPCLD